MLDGRRRRHEGGVRNGLNDPEPFLAGQNGGSKRYSALLLCLIRQDLRDGPRRAKRRCQ